MLRGLGVCALALIVTFGQSFAQGIKKPQPASVGKVAKHKPGAANASEKDAEALPCPRAAYKDDPVCFGADDKDSLPVPSGAPRAQERPADGLRVKPTANLNPRPTGVGPYQGGVVYQSNGNAVTNNFGGGMKVELPF